MKTRTIHVIHDDGVTRDHRIAWESSTLPDVLFIDGLAYVRKTFKLAEPKERYFQATFSSISTDRGARALALDTLVALHQTCTEGRLEDGSLRAHFNRGAADVLEDAVGRCILILGYKNNDEE